MAILSRHWPLVGSLALLALLLGVAQFGAPPRTVLTQSGVAARARIVARYGELPLAFEINQGQADEKVRFLARGTGYSLFLTPTEAVLALGPAGPDAHLPTDRQGHRATAPPARTPPTVMRLALAGANPAPTVEGLDLQPGRSHYLIGNDPARWHRNVARFGKVRYRQVYPGVDLVYYGNQRQLEYDFVVAPGTDPGRIQLKASGVQSLKLDDHGNLVLGTGHGDVLQHKPRVYQDIGGKRRMVDGRYALLDKQLVGFVVGKYDARQPLVIDPVLAYSTYLGGSGEDYGQGIAVDGSGNAYVAGYTNSIDFPITAGGRPKASIGVDHDVFITKLNPSGGLVYSTYLGGDFDDIGLAIAVDGTGNAYVTGVTNSLDFPTAAALQPALADVPNYYYFYGDAFVTKLDASGSALVYSTYLGGGTTVDPGIASADWGYGIAVDSIGNAYVTGETDAIDFPIVPGAAQADQGGGISDVFVTKFNAAGSALVYSTYLGGSDQEGALGIALDNAGNAYLTGFATTNFPTTAPLQAASGGSTDGFAAKLNATGSTWVYRTYLGGNGRDYGVGIAADAAGNGYITGYTESDNFPTANALRDHGSSGEGFVTKLNASGGAMAYSTYLGGAGYDTGNAIAVDNAGNAFVTGGTDSADFPLAGVPQVPHAFSYDAFVTRINAAGNALTYSTYLAGSDGDEGRAIAIDSVGNAYVAGVTESGNFPTVNPAQATYGGGELDGFVAKVSTSARRNDLNGDRHADILWRNHSTGANMAWKSASSATKQAMPAVANQDWQIVGVGDFNGDGKADILWRNSSTGADVIWKSGSAASTQAVDAVTNQAWQVAGVGDFNDDGKADILWRNTTSGADAIWKSGLKSTPQAINGVGNLAWHIVGVDDFNGDGKADILWRNASTGAGAIWKSGSAATQQAVAGVTSRAWQVAGTGDFNGDGKADILWRNTSTGANVIWKSGLKSAQQAVTSVTNPDWHIVAACDYNGDGIADILWRNLATGANVIWRSAKSSTQQAVAKVSNLAWVVAPPLPQQD